MNKDLCRLQLIQAIAASAAAAVYFVLLLAAPQTAAAVVDNLQKISGILNGWFGW